MKFLANIFDSQRKHFEKGGKLEVFYPLFEAKETFLFTTPHRTHGGAHIRDAVDSKRFMSTVIVALLPCLIFGIYNIGYQYYAAQGLQADVMNYFCIGMWKALPIILVSYAVGGTWELLFALIRKHEINEGFLVTGLLLPLIVPPNIPLWQLALAVSFGVVIGKEVFGGTGMNIFNPALTARAFLFFAFASDISGSAPWTFLGGDLVMSAKQAVAGWSGATPLAIASEAIKGSSVESLMAFAPGDYSLTNMFIGLIPGSIGETSTLACLVGALILIATGIASARIIISIFLGGAVMGLIFNSVADGSSNAMLAMPFYYHYVMGGFAFGAVFMATDPVSAANTNLGKIIYGFFIGFIAVLIRVVNPAYPEGMMLAILFMNMSAPLIDHYVVQAHIKKRLSRG